MIEDVPKNPDRLKHIHSINVRYDASKRKYLVVLKDPTDNSIFEIDWDTWITFGDWRQRKKEGNYY